MTEAVEGPVQAGPIQMFRASDGELFADEAAWRAHEQTLSQAESVNQWIASHNEPLPKAQATRARTLVMDYLNYVNAQK